jgi:hypothetical protein
MDEKNKIINEQQNLWHQYKQNLSFFKQRYPQIYNDIVSYTPVLHKLILTEEGYLNLINIQTGQMLYPENPKDYCEKQLKSFYESGSSLTIVEHLEHHKHFESLIRNKISYDIYHNLTLSEAKENYIFGTFLLSGIGIGYLLPMITSKTNINNIIIYEPNKDFFYASLHTINWAEIMEAFNDDYHKCILWIAQPIEAIPSRLFNYYSILGKHVFRQLEWMEHINDPKDRFGELMVDFIRLSYVFDGFVEYEKQSIARTIQALINKTKIFRYESFCYPPQNLSALVIYNGLSKKKLTEIIKGNKDNIVLISCGMAIKYLYELKVKPDIHVEINKEDRTYDFIKSHTSDEFRKGIKFVALNNVPIETHQLFDSAYMACKPNDSGSELLQDLTECNVKILQGSSTSTANLGVALSLALGFKDIYLLGFDMTAREIEENHDELSVFNSIGEELLYDNQNKENQCYTTMSNHGGVTETHIIWNTSKVLIEMIIASQDHSKIYNLSDGVMIKGAIPLKLSHLLIKPFENKQEIVQKLFEQNFYVHKIRADLSKEAITKKYVHPFSKNLEKFKLPEGAKTPMALTKCATHLWQNVRALEGRHPLTYVLIKGSIQSFMALLFKICSRVEPGDDFNQAFRVVRNGYHEYLEFAVEILEKDILNTKDAKDKYSHDDIQYNIKQDK